MPLESRMNAAPLNAEDGQELSPERLGLPPLTGLTMPLLGEGPGRRDDIVPAWSHSSEHRPRGALDSGQRLVNRGSRCSVQSSLAPNCLGGIAGRACRSMRLWWPPSGEADATVESQHWFSLRSSIGAKECKRIP